MFGKKEERNFEVNTKDDFTTKQIIGICEMVVGRPLIWELGRVARIIFKKLRRIKYRVDKNDPTKLIFTVKSHYADWDLLRKILERNYPTMVKF